MHSLAYQIAGEEFILSGSRTIYWPAQQALILSDLHLGKTTHFRKAGIAIPHQLFKEDLHRLWHCIQYYKPKQLIIVGDMFHSSNNKEHDLFLKWRNDISNVDLHLILGNHDILPMDWYAKARITTHTQHLIINEVAFVHDYLELPQVHYTFSGHVHPGVGISGLGRQSLRFACFHFTPTHCTLPAFGAFTGLASIKPTKKDKVFAIVENEVLAL